MIDLTQRSVLTLMACMGMLVLNACATSSIALPRAKPPVALNQAGSGIYPYGTRQVTLSVTTDQPAECRLGNSPGHPFGALYLRFASEDLLLHEYTVSTYDAGTSQFFVQCRDDANQLTLREEVMFNVTITDGQ